MEPKNSKIFSKEMLQAVSAFCESEDIKDIDKFMYLCFKQGFDIKRYGLLGKTLNEGEKDLIKEVIVEKHVEIPVEVIKEVEKIVEVIKEVPVEVVKEVEKIVTITNNEELEKKIIQLNNDLELEREIFSTKTEEMENNFQNEMSKKDNEIDELRRTLDELLAKPPVEIIKEIEKIVEDPVTNNKLNMLQETLQSLRKEIQQKNEKIKELETINRDFLGSNQNQAYLLKGSNLKDRI